MSTLSKVRQAMAAGLDGITLDGVEVVVHADIAESLEPPCYLLSWGVPMLEPMTGCNFTARPAVICVGGRITAADGQANVEYLVQAAIVQLRSLKGYAIDFVEQLVQTEVAGITYLTTRVIYRVNATI
jgi:hypothetical protein